MQTIETNSTEALPSVEQSITELEFEQMRVKTNAVYVQDLLKDLKTGIEAILGLRKDLILSEDLFIHAEKLRLRIDTFLQPMKYECGCVQIGRDNCDKHPEAAMDFFQPCAYKGPFVGAVHYVPVKAEQMTDPVGTEMMVALHKCRKDQMGFIEAMERFPATELYPIEEMHTQCSDYEQAWEKIVPPLEHTAFRGDVVTIIDKMRPGLLVDKL